MAQLRRQYDELVKQSPWAREPINPLQDVRHPIAEWYVLSLLGQPLAAVEGLIGDQPADTVWLPGLSRPAEYALWCSGSRVFERGGTARERHEAWPCWPLLQLTGDRLYTASEIFSTTCRHPVFRNLRRARQGDEDQADSGGAFDMQTSRRFPVCEADCAFAYQRAGANCDVFYAASSVLAADEHQRLKVCFRALAKQTRDFPVPNYQNIIDPNMYLTPDSNTWLATSWLVERQHDRRLTASYTSPVYDLAAGDHGNDVHHCVHAVFEASLPLLAQLRRPALLLPGPLQTVVKVQKIYLEPGAEYVGTWHRDGSARERVVAVVLYYFRHDASSSGDDRRCRDGGQLEFFDKTPLVEPFWVGGDCDPTPLKSTDATFHIRDTPNCKVPVREGTMVVFSNYQMLHRVLRMRNHTSQVVARSFVCLFVVDQRHPIADSSDSDLLMRISRVPLDQRKEMRSQQLLEQLRPCGTFGLHNTIYSTGNGSAALLGWLEQRQRDGNHEDIQKMIRWSHNGDRDGLIRIGALNVTPPEGRGVSWAEQFEFRQPNNLQFLCWQAILAHNVDYSCLPSSLLDDQQYILQKEVAAQFGSEQLVPDFARKSVKK